MPDPFLDYLHEAELGRGRLTGSTLPETQPPQVAFAKPLMRPVEKPPAEEDPFLAHLRGLETTSPLPPPPERGVIGDIASSLARGVTVGIPQMGGQAITGLGALTGIEPLKETGRAITGFAEELPEKVPFLAPSEKEGEGGFRRFLTGMGESLPVILAAAKGGAAIGSLTAPVTGFVGPTVGAILGGMVGVFGTFGLAGKGRAYEEALTQGLPEDQAQSYSNKIGAIEGGVWSLLAPVEAATGGLAGKFIKKPAIDTVRKLLTPTLTKSLTGMAVNVPAVTAAGATSAALQAQAAEQAGLPGPTPEEAAYESIAPSIGISILFGLGTRGMAWKDRQAIFTSLRNPTIDPAFRNRAADTVFRNLNKIDPEVAEMWRREAGYRVEGRKEIPIDEDYMAWIAKGQADRVPAMWGTAGGGLPVPWEEPVSMARGPIPQPPPKLLTTRVPEGVAFGEDFIMAEPWIFERGGDGGYYLANREKLKLLTGREKPIPELPFYPEPGKIYGEDFFTKEPPRNIPAYAKVGNNAFREILNPQDIDLQKGQFKEGKKAVLGDEIYTEKQVRPTGSITKKGRIAPEAGVTSAGVLPTERPSPPAPGAKLKGKAEKEAPRPVEGPPPGGEAIPPTETPPPVEKAQTTPTAPLPDAQMDAIRTQGKETGGLGIAMVQRIITNLGEKISVKKAKEALDYLQATGEIQPQVGGGSAMFSYTFTGKAPEKSVVPLPEGAIRPKRGYGYIKTDAGWEVYHEGEGKIGIAKSRDTAREMIDAHIKGKPPGLLPSGAPPPPSPPPAPGEVAPPLVAGERPEEVITPRGLKAQTRFKVVDADELVTSIDTNFKENTDYLQDLQPRDRDKVTSMNQIMRIYSKLDPEQLAESRGADTGAPIVGSDNMVESGNGRAVAIKKLYADAHANAEKYRTWLTQNAERFGLTKEEVSKIKNPVLVRENLSPMSPEQRVAFARDANTPTTLVMSAGEKAKIDMDRLTPDVLSVFAPDESGSLLAASNREFIRSFLAKVPANEMGDFITEKEGGLGAEAKLSAQGLARIKNAIFAKAYGKENSDLITMMTEDPENNVKNITNALLTAAPRQATLMDAIARGDRHDLAIAKEISDAARTLSELRNAGTSTEEYLIQGNLFGKNPIETELVKLFNDYKQAPRKIIDTLDAYAKMVDDLGNPKQMGMFGAEKPPERLSVLTAARELVEEKYATKEQKGLFPAEGEPERGLPPERPLPQETPGGIPEPEKPAPERLPGERAGEPTAELKPETLDLTSIPENLTVDVKAIREKTGKEITIQENARKALEDTRKFIDKYKSLMECLKA